jgi:ferrochelatase
VIGIILLNLGGPDSIDAVKPFLYNLFSDRDIIRLGPEFLQKTIASLIIRAKLKNTIAAYNLIGGKSPLPGITISQARKLEEIVSPVRVYVGMRYWHPFTEETLEQMSRDGIKKIIALSLYPHYSVATTGSSIKHFEKAASKYSFEYSCITSWFDHPLYINALAELIEQGIRSFDSTPAVLFSAHSLPKKFVDAGDPYVLEIQGTIESLTRKLDLNWFLSWQSKTGPVKWLEPTTEHMLNELAGKGIKNLLVVPISFVSDHVETLYEIDILYVDIARNLGITLKRAESLNTSVKFIEALADIATKRAAELGWR